MNVKQFLLRYTPENNRWSLTTPQLCKALGAQLLFVCALPGYCLTGSCRAKVRTLAREAGDGRHLRSSKSQCPHDSCLFPQAFVTAGGPAFQELGNPSNGHELILIQPRRPQMPPLEHNTAPPQVVAEIVKPVHHEGFPSNPPRISSKHLRNNSGQVCLPNFIHSN